MISNAETLKANEYVRRRILRLQQVREQSKNIAKELRLRVNKEKARQIIDINATQKQNFDSFKKKAIDNLRSGFDNRLSGIGSSHAAAFDEDLATEEWKVQKNINRRLATDRGSQAASTLRREKARRNTKRVVPIKQSARYVQRGLPSNLKKLSIVSAASDNLKDFYLENGDPDNDCPNVNPDIEIDESNLTTQSKTTNAITEQSSQTEAAETSTNKDENSSPKGKLKINSDRKIIFEVSESSDDVPSRGDPSCVSNNESCNVNADSCEHVLTPTETLRLLKISTDSNSKSIDETVQRQHSKYLQAIEEETTTQTDREPRSKSLHTMSTDNPFNAISEHIKRRNIHIDTRPLYNKLSPRFNRESNDVNKIRDLIQHVRHAPCTNNAPSIPNLPENYKRQQSEREKDYLARKKQMNLLATAGDWIPKSSRYTERKSCVTGCRCTSSCCGDNQNIKAARSKPLRGILSQSTSSSSRNIKYVTGKPPVRCKPEVPGSRSNHFKGKILSKFDNASRKYRVSPIKKSVSDSTGNRGSARIVKSYDQAHKFAKNVMVDSREFVEKLPKEGKNAYEMAKDEIIETDRARMGLDHYYNDEARRVRGERAMQKVLADKDYVNMQKELDTLTKEQRLHGRKLPDTAYMFDDRLKEKENLRQKQLEKAFEEATRISKVHRYPIPITAPVVQPQYNPSTRRDIDKQQSKVDVYSSDASQQSNQKTGRTAERKISVVNVGGSWDVGSVRMTDDLDEIPTRDSDSTVPSVTNYGDRTQSYNVERVLNLVEKQKEQLVREVERMKAPADQKLRKTKSPKKIDRKVPERSKSPKKGDRKVPEISDSEESTDERKKTSGKAVKKRVKSLSPKQKVITTRSDGVENEKTSKAVPHNRKVSNATSSISFQGFQIVIEVKKGSKQETIGNNDEKIKTVKGKQDLQDSSTEMSITAAQFMSKKEVFIEKGINNSVLRFDTSESTAYMSPPEKFTSNAIKTLFGPSVATKNVHTQYDVNVKNKKPSKSKNEVVSDWEAVHPEAFKILEDKKKGIKSKKNKHSDGKWEAIHSDAVIDTRRKDISESSKSEQFYETESTISREISINRVSSYSQNENSCKNSADKGIQVSSSLRMSTEVFQSTSQNILKESNKKATSEPDPALKKYIRQLLEMSKDGVNKLNVDISDISTPSSSIINVSTNNTLPQNSKLNEKVEKLKTFIDENYSLLAEFGKENKFDDNYRFKHEHVSRSQSSRACSDRPMTGIDSSSVRNVKSSARLCENHEREQSKQAAKNIILLKKKEISEKNEKKALKMNYPKSPPVKDLTSRKESSPPKNSPRLEIHFDKCDKLKNSQDAAGLTKKVSPKHIITSPSRQVKNSLTNENEIASELNCLKDFESVRFKGNNAKKSNIAEAVSNEQFIPPCQDHNNIENYIKLRAQCSQRISNLSHMLEQIRKDKQTTLSSNSSPLSEELNTSSKNKSSNSLSNNDNVDIGYVPLFADIPKPHSNGDSQSSDGMSSMPPKKDSLLPEIWDCDVPPLGLKKISISESDICLESFNNSDCESPEKRPKPPAALTRHPIMRSNDVEYCIPHELSTIVEVDTPITVRNASAQSKHIENSPSSVKSAKILPDTDKSLLPCVYYDYTQKPKLIIHSKGSHGKNSKGSKDSPAARKNILNSQVETEVKLKPFLSFKDYVKRRSDVIGVDDIINHLHDSTLKRNEHESSSDDTLPDIIPEMIKRNLILKPVSADNSSSNCSVEYSSSSSPNDSAPHIVMPLKSSPHKSRRRRSEPNAATKDKNNPSISGIQAFVDTSASSFSERSTSELEKALKSMGIGWGVSTLKKTKETMALSSSSSSLPKDKRQQNHTFDENLQSSKDLMAELANLSGSSVGLSTLMDELNISEHRGLKANPSPNASKVSLNQDLEILLSKIAAVKSAIIPKSNPKSKSGDKKSSHVLKESTVGDTDQTTGRQSLRGSNPSIKVNLFSEEASLSGLQGSRDKTHHRTSTPVQMKSASHSSSTLSSSHHASNGLFSIESDLSSVKNNNSNIENNISSADKEGLFVPNMSLKFGKLFDSTIKSEK